MRPRFQISRKAVSFSPCRTISKCQHRRVARPGRARQQRTPHRRVFDRRQQRVAGVARVVGEIDPRIKVHQHAAREHREGDVRRLQRVAAARHRAGLDRHHPEAALAVGRDPPEAAEIRVERLVVLAVLGMVVAAGGVGLPQLDHRVRHRRAVAVEHPPLDRDALARRVAPGQIAPFRPVEPEMKERPDRLRRGRDQLLGHRLAPQAGSAGVAARPRNTMSKR